MYMNVHILTCTNCTEFVSRKQTLRNRNTDHHISTLIDFLTAQRRYLNCICDKALYERMAVNEESEIMSKEVVMACLR
jgi:hypothetical protein